MFAVSNLLPVVLYLAIAVSQLQSAKGSGGKWIQQETVSTLGAIDQKILDKHHSLRELIVHAHNSPHRWQPSNSSHVVPFLDKVGICTVTNHILQSQKKHSGGILFIGDDTENIATVKLASALGPHMTSLSCSNKACTYSVCGSDVVTKLSYVSMKKFMHDSCIHSDAHKNQHCDDRLFAATMSNYDIIVFGMSPVVAKIHAVNATNDIAHEVRAIASWMNSNFTSVLQADGVQGTSLFLYQTAWPTEMYCTTGESGPKKKERYQQLQMHDQFLWTELSTGALSKIKSLTLQRIDLSEAVAAREELYARDSSNSGKKHSHCEQYTGRSDSIQLLLNTVYGAILDHVHPRAFPRALSGFLAKEDYTKAIQRVALTEVSVLNYLTALHTIQSARNKGWRLPQDTAVTLTLTDIRYQEHFPYWYHSRRQYDVEGIMIGMDNETCGHLVQHYQDFLYLCMRVPETMRMAPPYKQTTFVGVGKIIYPLLFLAEHNMSVIFSEMDVFWRNNPYPFFAQADRKVYDVEVSAHVNFNNKKQVITIPKELNIGFFYARPTPAGRQLFVDLLHFLFLMPFEHIDKVTADQKLFDRFIRNVPAPAGEEQPCMGELFIGWEKVRPAQHFEGFKWSRLPGALFTHNDVDELAILPETLTYHISWGVDPPSRRVYCAHTLGLLPSNYTPTTQFARQTCFKYLYK